MKLTEHLERSGYIMDADIPWKEMGDGTRRKILGYEPQMLMMRNAFDAGTIGQRHSHPHVQSSYVMSGRFEITIGDRTEALGAGDSFLVPSDVVHAADCIEAGEIIEVFTPIRSEFV